MTSTRPYLIRAIHDWAADNGLTPQILVNADFAGAQVPERFVKDGQIVLNIGPDAVQMHAMDNEKLAFSARFGGVTTEVFVPIDAVLAIFARENGQGIFFQNEETPPEPDDGAGSGNDGPKLRLVK